MYEENLFIFPKKTYLNVKLSGKKTYFKLRFLKKT